MTQHLPGFKYKVGDIDKAKVCLKNNGIPIKLTGAIVVFNMTSTQGVSKTLECTLGYYNNNEILLETDGYVTMNVTADATSSVATYYGEFVIIIGSDLVAHDPSDDIDIMFQVFASK
jgi:hypothetical protein